MKWQAVAVASLLVLTTRASAAGTSDAQIKLGQTMSFSGPASAYGVVAKTQSADFKQGGVNGRKINRIVLDENGLDGTALPTGGRHRHASLKCRR